MLSSRKLRQQMSGRQVRPGAMATLLPDNRAEITGRARQVAHAVPARRFAASGMTSV